MNDLEVHPVPITWIPELPIYASESFLQTVSSEYGWIGGVSSGVLRCILPYTVIRRPAFRIVRFRLATVPIDWSMSADDDRAFLTKAAEYFRAADMDLIMPGANSAVFRTYPEGAIAAPYGTLIQDLSQAEDAIFAAIHPTFRYNIRRAMREGVQIREGIQYLEDAYALIAHTLQRSDQAFRTLDDFRRAVLALGEQVKVLVAEREGIYEGAMVAPFSAHAAYTWYCGSREKPTLGSMHLLHWEAMRLFRSLNVKRFDFQGVRINPEKGSKQEGIFNFKRRFGGTLTQGFVWKCALKALKSVAYDCAVRLLHGGDIVDQERRRSL